jgi:hypothetical protein
MKWTDDIKAGIGRHLLMKKIRYGERTVKMCSPGNARNMGILFNATENTSFEIVKEMVKKLPGGESKIRVLGYVDDKNVAENYLYRKGFDFFSKSDLNWYYKPISAVAEKFMLEPFDLLLNLCLDDPFPVQYITSVSPALFKAGRYFPANQSLDLMIDIENAGVSLINSAHHVAADKNSESKINISPGAPPGYLLKFLIEQLIHYLSIINK